MQDFALVAVEPLEQMNRNIAAIGEAAAELLRAVDVRVDQAGNDQLAARVDGLFGFEFRRNLPGRTDGGDAVFLDCDRAVPAIRCAGEPSGTSSRRRDRARRRRRR